MRPSVPRSLLSALALAAFIAPHVEAGPPVAANRSDRDSTFKAEWSMTGSADAVAFGSGREARVFRHTGTLTVVTADGRVTNALSKCIGMSDSTSGAASRCVWVDSDGDEMFSELQGPPAANQQTGRSNGSFVGGTGKYAGLQGEYELHWVRRPVDQPRGIAGQTLQMTGSWRVR